MSIGPHIDALLAQGATFAAFRMPGEAPVAWVQHDPELRPPHAGQRCFVLAPFDAGDGPTLCIRPDLELTAALAPLAANSGASGHRAAQAAASGLDRAGYKAAVEQAITAIRAGLAEKVVLARTIEAGLGGCTLGALFDAAAQALPDAFVAMASTDPYGLWLGASPERLLVVRDGTVEVDALAGTMPVEAAPDRAKDWGAKERGEQALVTRMVKATLIEAGAMDVMEHAPRVKAAGPVAHLHTRITGALGLLDTLGLAKALHPTPAVCGTPTPSALRMIKALEPRGRSLYAGYWGPVEAGSASLYVNIRCMQLFTGSALLHVGAGITGDSVPDRECDEVERKASTWLGLLEAQLPRG